MKHVQDTLLNQTFDKHDWHHRPTCFKEGPGCQFFLLELSWLVTGVYKDMDENKMATIHRLVHGDTLKVPPWMFEQRRPLGCEYINTNCQTIAEVFACNTNIQIGDRSQIFYSILYFGKSTQKEDSGRVKRINLAINKRPLFIREQIMSGDRDREETQEDFVEESCRILSAMCAATSRNVVSATMAYLLVCNRGIRFKCSHGFGHLLVGQYEAISEG